MHCVYRIDSDFDTVSLRREVNTYRNMRREFILIWINQEKKLHQCVVCLYLWYKHNIIYKLYLIYNYKNDDQLIIVVAI